MGELGDVRSTREKNISASSTSVPPKESRQIREEKRAGKARKARPQENSRIPCN